MTCDSLALSVVSRSHHVSVEEEEFRGALELELINKVGNLDFFFFYVRLGLLVWGFDFSWIIFFNR